MPLITPSARKVSWATIRAALKNVIIAAAPNAMVHSRWPLQFDIPSTLQYLASEANPDKIHAWMISAANLDAEEEKVGGTEYMYTVTFRIWGFKGLEFGTDASNSQDSFEDEVDDVVAYIKANRLNGFGITDPNMRIALSDNTLPNFELDVVSLGAGYDLHLAKGTMIFRIRR
jgi:hypothetical protein